MKTEKKFKVRLRGKGTEAKGKNKRLSGYKGFKPDMDFRTGTSREINMSANHAGLKFPALVTQVQSCPFPFKKSPLYEGIRTKSGYTVKHSGQVRSYTYSEALENARRTFTGIYHALTEKTAGKEISGRG